MKNRFQKQKWALYLLGTAVLVAGLFGVLNRVNVNPGHVVGDVIDTYNGVPVYFNGAIGHVTERNVAPDGYNIGLKYQCVEFVKRYYYERFGHRMPQDRGHARDFFDPALSDGAMNAARGLMQFKNGAGTGPMAEDLVVFGPWLLNRYGHVAIVSEVGPDFVEVVQQNPGPFGASRERYRLVVNAGNVRIDHARLVGWLRRADQAPANNIRTVEKASAGVAY